MSTKYFIYIIKRADYLIEKELSKVYQNVINNPLVVNPDVLKTCSPSLDYLVHANPKLRPRQNVCQGHYERSTPTRVTMCKIWPMRIEIRTHIQYPRYSPQQTIHKRLVHSCEQEGDDE